MHAGRFSVSYCWACQSSGRATVPHCQYIRGRGNCILHNCMHVCVCMCVHVSRPLLRTNWIKRIHYYCQGASSHARSQSSSWAAIDLICCTLCFLFMILRMNVRVSAFPSPFWRSVCLCESRLLACAPLSVNCNKGQLE